MVPSIHSIISRIAICLAVAFCVGMAPNTSLADKKPKRPSRMKMKKAKRHYGNALDHHERKEYDAAAAEYERAYSFYANPEFLFNAAQVYRLAGKTELAIGRYERYLELEPEGRGAADARANLPTLRQELAEARRAEDAKRKASAKRAQDVKRRARAKQEAAAKAKAQDTKLSTTAKPSKGRGLRIAGIATGGAGLVALGLGVKFGLDARKLETDVEENTAWDRDQYDRGQVAERNMYISYAVGAAAVLAGGVLYSLGRNTSSETNAALSLIPTATNEGGGFVLSGAF